MAAAAHGDPDALVPLFWRADPEERRPRGTSARRRDRSSPDDEAGYGCTYGHWESLVRPGWNSHGFREDSDGDGRGT